MYIIMNERAAGKTHIGKTHMIMTILNSMSIPERKEFLNKIYGMYADTDSIKVISSIDTADLMAIKNEFEQIHAENEAIEVEVARIDDEIDGIKLDTARINAQAETIEKLCKIIKFILPRVNANPFSKEYEDIKKTLEEIYKEI